MGNFNRNENGDVYLEIGLFERPLTKDDVVAMLGDFKKNNTKNKWKSDALETFLDLENMFARWKGVHIAISEIGSPAFKYEIAIDGVKAIDIYRNSVLEKCIMRSCGFDISDSCIDYGFMRMDLAFTAQDDMDSVDSFLGGFSGNDSLREVVNKIIEIAEIDDELELKLDPYEISKKARDVVTQYFESISARKASDSYLNLIDTVCALLSAVADCSVNCPGEFCALCNGGTLRLNARICSIDTFEIKMWLRPLLAAVSNVHISHTDGTAIIDESRYMSDFDDSYLAFDISIDIPILS